jgi:hypothetical protein
MLNWFPFSASSDEHLYQRERVHSQRIPSIDENEMKELFPGFIQGRSQVC